jgi:hypothetical protein
MKSGFRCSRAGMIVGRMIQLNCAVPSRMIMPAMTCFVHRKVEGREVDDRRIFVEAGAPPRTRRSSAAIASSNLACASLLRINHEALAFSS